MFLEKIRTRYAFLLRNKKYDPFASLVSLNIILNFAVCLARPRNFFAFNGKQIL